MPKTSTSSRWLDAVPADTFFWTRDVPGDSRAAVHAFLSREIAKPDPDRRALRVAPRLYWRSTHDLDPHLGTVLRPDIGRVGRTYAGPNAARAGWYGANSIGWSTQLALGMLSFAVPGVPRSRQPTPKLRMLGRRNPRRRDLTAKEAVYLETTVHFDRLHHFNKHAYLGAWDGDAYDLALEVTERKVQSLLAEHPDATLPRPDALRWAAAGERPASGVRLLGDRIERLASLFERHEAGRRR